MIEKMKAVCIVTQDAKKEEFLLTLQNLGMLHLSEKQAPSPSLLERFSVLSRLSTELKGYTKGKKQSKEKTGDILTDEQFEKIHQDTCRALERKNELMEKQTNLLLEIERVKPWGDFDPCEIKEIAQKYELHFYRLDKKEYQTIQHADNVTFLSLASVEKMHTIATFGALDSSVRASEFIIPPKGLSQLNQEVQACQKELSECESILSKSAEYLQSYSKQLIKIQNDAAYSSADRTLENDSGLIWISGYIPAACEETFSHAAKSHHWAWLITDVDDGDTNVPTKIRYNRLTALIKPVFDILGTVPGYREYDISFWFLAFFALFFAMIIGDAGYGMLFLISTAIVNLKTRKVTNVMLLLYLLSGATIVWGALTGTWFGLEKAMTVPLLKKLVIPEFANYPEYFNISSTTAQNNVMKFCFTIGAIQLALACIMNIKRKIRRNYWGWLADVGWLFSISSLYFMVLYLVIGQTIHLGVIGIFVGVGFLLVILFGGMEPGKSFLQGLKAGIGSTFTVFLDTISAFGNVMSYIRLFAVGMASLAIAQSFNNMASGFSGALMIVGAIIMVIGHLLNIIMGFLSVVVHGVRLNLLEFSGQLGMEWSGIAYDPFRDLTKTK